MSSCVNTRNILLLVLIISVGLLLLASNYDYSGSYYVQAWWPILFVIAGAFLLNSFAVVRTLVVQKNLKAVLNVGKQEDQ